MSFILFARAHGVEIDPNKFFPSDRIRRCGTVEKPRSGNGAYFYDGQRGWVMDWSGEARVIWFEDPNAVPWTDEQKRRFITPLPEDEIEHSEHFYDTDRNK